MTALSHDCNSSTVIQITDSHLFAAADGKLLGMPTWETYTAVVDLLVSQHEHIDLVVASGDISQDGSLHSYQRFLQQMERIKSPMRWLAGNHDENPVLHQVGLQEGVLESVYDLPYWRVIMLDSSVTAAVHGHLSQQQLIILRQAVETAGERHVLIVLHHHPVPMGSAWLDNLGLRNANEFFDVVEGFSSVKAVIWGHVHQEFSALKNNIQLLSAPSTCVQFKPCSEDFAVDTKAPGYRWFKLHADGTFASGVNRIETARFPVNTDYTGY